MDHFDKTDNVIRLPQDFLTAMEGFLEEDFGAFLRSYDERPKKGLFFNIKKVRKETVRRLIDEWKLEPVPGTEIELWPDVAEGPVAAKAPEKVYLGYRYNEDIVRPGKSPYHDAGVYYIQEPSAMIPVMKAGIEPGDLVLDLCAAPGGKSSQAAQLAGLLISNEITPKRARILSSNMERMGYDNVIVCSASPSELSEVFPGFFDKIIVDAPCSGEGMFRKDETAIAEWSLDNVYRCVDRQRDILTEALKMLKPGGRIVYSTCTFEPYENKWQLRRFVSQHEDELVLRGFETLFPHSFPGEGQFYGVMDSKSEGFGSDMIKEGAINELSSKMKRAGIHVLRSGIEAGELITGRHKGKERYEHSHAEAMKAGDPIIKPNADLKTEELALRFLRGESLRLSSLSESDLTLFAEDGEEIRVCYDGYPLGLGKLSNDTIKNKLPKGLRRLG